MQDILKDLFDADSQGISPPQNWTTRAAEEIRKLRVDAKAIGEELAETRLTILDKDRLIIAERDEADRLKAELAEREAEVGRLREALDTIEGLATDTTFDIQGIAKQVLKQNETFKTVLTDIAHCGNYEASQRAIDALKQADTAKVALAGKEKEDESEQYYTDSDR